MKNIKRLLLALAVILVLPMCKKGENDPFISLRSRDARITAKWKLTKIEGKTTIAAVPTEYKYDGSIYSMTTTPGGTTTATGTFEMTIDKRGSLLYSGSYTQNAQQTVTTGENYWYWISNNKNKCYIYLGVPVGGQTLFVGGEYAIDQLKHKELILAKKDENTTGTVKTTTEMKYTFTKAE